LTLKTSAALDASDLADTELVAVVVRLDGVSFPSTPKLSYSKLPLVPLPTVVVPTVTEVALPPEIVLQPNPVPLVQISAFDPPEQLGTLNPLGAVAVNEPSTWLADKAARLTVTVPEVPPPVRPVPAVTPVMVPLPPPVAVNVPPLKLSPLPTVTALAVPAVPLPPSSWLLAEGMALVRALVRAAVVSNVPLVGKVTFVAAVNTKVEAKAPLVVNEPPRVTVLLPLFTPVPPFAELTGLERLTVTFPLVPPPVSPVPAVTPVMVPLPPVALRVPPLNERPEPIIACPSSPALSYKKLPLVAPPTVVVPTVTDVALPPLDEMTPEPLMVIVAPSGLTQPT